MIRLSPGDLEGLPTPRAAADFLGPLASWVLRPDLRGELGLAPPRLPDEPGSVIALFVADAALRKRWFADAFGLPLCWRPGSPEDPGLPGGLSAEAGRVRDGLRVGGWGLGFADALGRLDLGRLSFSCESVWAPLAAALRLAIHGGRPDPRVLATGAFGGGALRRVEGVGSKLEAVVALAGSAGGGVRRPCFWVPAANFDEAEEASQGRVEVRAFPTGGRIEAGLDGLLVQLDSPPSVEGPGDSDQELDLRLRYANRPWIAGDGAVRGAFYERALLGPLAERLRRAAGFHGADRSYQRLVAPLGLFVGADWLSARAVRPTGAVRFLATPESLERNRGRLGSWAVPGTRIESPWVVREDDLAGSGAAPRLEEIAGWLRGDGRGRALVDITAGRKEQTALLICAARRAGADVGYVRHATDAQNRVTYGEERYVFLPWVRDPDRSDP